MKSLAGWIACAGACLCLWLMIGRSNRFESELVKFKREAVQRGAASLQYDLRGEVFLMWEEKD